MIKLVTTVSKVYYKNTSTTNLPTGPSTGLYERHLMMDGSKVWVNWKGGICDDRVSAFLEEIFLEEYNKV